jgi:replication-associated recombination protein RarA
MTTQKENKTRTLHTRIKQSTWEKIAAMAEADGRTVTGWLEWIVEREYAKSGLKTP